jgi:Holliday junction resolvasome RuvABC endonuclease subunit
MIYLGIDQSYTSSGIVVVKDQELLYSSVFKTPKDEDIFDRAWRISEHVLEVVEKFGVELIAIEGLAFGMTGNATRDLAGLQFLIVSKVRQIAKKRIVIVSPKSLKVFATTNGKAKKKDMIGALPDEIVSVFKGEGYKLTTGLADLADAYFLAQYVKNEESKQDLI